MSSNLYFDTFKRPNDHALWESHLQYVSKDPELDELEKKEILQALRLLQMELGDSFLKEISHTHPLFRILTEKCGWRYADLKSLAKTLQLLKPLRDSYQNLLQKLKGKDACMQEGIPLLDITKMFHCAGFEVLIPWEIKNQKNPDLSITYPSTNDHFYVEVSKLGVSEKHFLLSETFNVFFREFNFTGNQFPHSCKLLRPLSKEEVAIGLKRIRGYQKEVSRNEGVRYFKDDAMIVAIAHPNKQNELTNWVDQHDFRMGLQGPTLDFDETDRILNKLGKKAKQIPEKTTGLIYIPVQSSYFLTTNISHAVAKIEQALSKYPDVFGVAIFASLIHDPKLMSHTENGHVYRIKKVNDAVAQHFLFVRNQHFSGSLELETVVALYNSFQ